MSLKKMRLVLILGLFGLGLLACGGDDDSGSSDTQKSMSSDGAVETYDPDVPLMVVEDNGVVHVGNNQIRLELFQYLQSS